MDSREQRKQQARKHLAFVEENFKEDILQSVRGSLVVDDASIEPAAYDGSFGDSRIVVEPLTTTQALFKYCTNGSVALLNFASYKHPGGGFLNGSLAQEEALCADSTLYPVLRSFEAFYAENKRHTNDGLYANRGIFSPGICFLGDEGNVYADVVSVAAPNRSHNAEKVSDKENREALNSRCEFVYNVAAQHSQANVLILGAFGCGVFRQKPEDVAGIFKRIVMAANAFDVVVFAVPRGRDKNFDTFRRVLQRANANA